MITGIQVQNLRRALRAYLHPILVGLVLSSLALLAWGGPAPSPEAASVDQLQWRYIGDASNRWRQGLPTGSDIYRRQLLVMGVVRFSESDINSGRPTLTVSGPFSAELRLNGVSLGGKGAPGASRQSEIAGNIDDVFPLGAAARAGDNVLLMRVSAWRLDYSPHRLFHRLAINHGAAEPVRPYTLYSLAISQVGLLLFLAGAGLARARTHRRAELRHVALAALFLILALGAETVRMWWNYPYHFHELRLNVVWLALTAFAGLAASATTATLRVTCSWRWLAAMIAMLIACLAIDAIDGRSRVSLTLVMGATCAMALPLALARERLAMTLCGIASAMVAGLWLLPITFMDSGIYLTGAAYLAVLLSSDSSPEQRRDNRTNETLDLDRGEAVTAAGIVFAQAAGNYSNIRLKEGASVLVRRTLRELAQQPLLIRVHRSYVVNLSLARRLIARTGSRYVLELQDGECVPVGRRHVAEIRQCLAKHSMLSNE